MYRVVLEGTDLEVSKVGFGTSALHHSFTSSERLSILRAALDGGITHFDSARLYGYGIAEKELGRFFGKNDRKGLTISTKVGFDVSKLQQRFPLIQVVGRKIIGKILPNVQKPMIDFSPTGCDKSFSNSLRSLNTEWVDILFVHEPALASFSQLNELIPWLKLQKSLGKARYIGLAGENLLEISNDIISNAIFDVFQTSKYGLVVNNGSLIRPQIEYGYFSNLSINEREVAIEKATCQKSSGMILYSSRQVARINAFCSKFSAD